jgi:imidazolonepropionase-like amidohydrolase
MRRLIVVTAVLILSTAGALRTQSPATLAFTGATLVDGTGAAPVENAVVVITGDRITAAGPAARVAIPAGATRVDARGKTILPGLLNAHGHVGGATSERAEVDRQLALYARYAVTTVFSLGGDGPHSLRARDEPARGRSRLYVAGAVVDGRTAAAVDPQVAANAARNVDWIKIRVDDNLGTGTKMPREAWQAAIARAHAVKLPVAAHMFYLEDAKALVDSGIDLLAHSVRDRAVDAELIQRARSRNVCLVPTLTREVAAFVYESTPAFFADPFFTRHADQAAVAALSTPARQEQTRQSAAARAYKAALEQASRNLKALADGGVRIAMGTDSGAQGRFQGYFEHLELDLMVKAGLSPMQAIVAATGDAARCMGQTGRLGTIQPGAFADLATYRANPVADIANTKTLEDVWVGGVKVIP